MFWDSVEYVFWQAAPVALTVSMANPNPNLENKEAIKMMNWAIMNQIHDITVSSVYQLER